MKSYSEFTAQQDPEELNEKLGGLLRGAAKLTGAGLLGKLVWDGTKWVGEKGLGLAGKALTALPREAMKTLDGSDGSIENKTSEVAQGKEVSGFSRAS